MLVLRLPTPPRQGAPRREAGPDDEEGRRLRDGGARLFGRNPSVQRARTVVVLDPDMGAEQVGSEEGYSRRQGEVPHPGMLSIPVKKDGLEHVGHNTQIVSSREAHVLGRLGGNDFRRKGQTGGKVCKF